MNQKLFEKSPDFYSGICRFLSRKTIGRLCLIVLLSFISTTGFAQLASQNFDSGIPGTWTKAYVGGTSQWTTSADGYLGSAGAAYVNPSAENIGSGSTARYYLITPQFTAPATGEVRFFTKQSSATDYGNIYEVRVSTVGPSDLNSFTTVLGTFTETQLNTTTGYEEKVVSLGAIAPGLNIYVAFVLVNQQVGATPNADDWFIDNVSVQTQQVCDPVVASTITATGITNGSANINWTHPTATQFQIIVQQASLPAPSASATGTPVTGTTYPAGSLTGSTAYTAYIKTICSQSVSAWTPYNFSTVALGSSCAYPIIIPPTGAPYSFTGNLSNFQNTAVTYTTQGSNCLAPSITQNYLNGAKAFFSYTPTQNGLLTVTNVTTANTAQNGFNYITGFFVYDGCSNVGVACLGGNNTSAAGVSKTIPNVYVEAGHTYLIVVSSQLTPSAGILFTLSVNTAACAPPAVFTYKDLLQTSVKFSWDNVGNLSNSWEYRVQASGSAAPTAASTGTPTSTNTDVNINTGLAAGTSYDLYVRSVCGGTPGAWSVAYKFTTQCTVFPTPYSQNFTGTSTTVPAACWTSMDVNNDGAIWTYLSSAATMQTNTNQNYNNDYFVSPQVNFTGVQKRLRYKHSISGAGSAKYLIKISTTGIGVSNFTTTLMPETAISNTTLTEKIINIPTSITGPVNIAFVVIPGTGSTATRINIDDVFIEDKPACPDPISPTVSNVTTTTAQLAWTIGDAETQWEVAVQPAGTGVPTADGLLVSSNPYTATVNPSTAYEYYVRAYCSSTQKSNWIGPVTFNTLCTAFNTPFIENFNNGDVANSHKFCWTITDVNGGGTFTMGATEAQLTRPAFNAPTSYNDWLITPAINVVGTKELKFKYKSATSIFHATARNGVEVLMSTTDTNPASFTVISPLLVSTNVDYVEKALYINANGPVYIAFRVPPSYSVAPGTANLYIDDVRVDEAPACPNPSLLTVSNITVNSAHFAWTKGFLETQWQVAVLPAGSGIPTTGTLADTNPQFTTTTPLSADTQYEVYVRAYCNGTDQSNWIGPVKFKTLCNPIAAPFTETFEPNSTTEQCWVIRNELGSGTGGGLVYTWNTNAGVNPYEGSQAAGIFSGTNGDNNDWLISPTITVTAGQRLRYYYRVNSSDFSDDLEVMLSTTGIESANFTTMLYTTDTDAPLTNEEWKEKVINLPAGVTGNINIAWHIPQKPANPWGYRGQMVVIDKVVIENIPACPQPTNLTVLSVTDAQAQLRWDATGTETEWDIYVQPSGLAAPVGDGNPAYLSTVTANPYTKTGLTSATMYDYYVRAACGTGDSAWVGPFTFTTLCPLDTACEYTFILGNVNAGGISGEIQLIQNGIITQTFTMSSSSPAGATQTFTAFLCDGVEYSLFWDAIGTLKSQFAGAYMQIMQGSTMIWSSTAMSENMNDVVYTGFSSCSPVTCPQPTNLTVSEAGVLSWTAGGTETQWEVFIQPVYNNTLPQTGTLVTTNSYTPAAADFNNIANGTYEFFVRAVCSDTNKSFWFGPKKFVRNDSSAKAVVVPVNTGDTCEVYSANATFLGATPSVEPMTCTGVNNGDIWYQFQATSTAHVISLEEFSGGYDLFDGNPAHPFITMTLYRVNGTALEEVACSSVNTIMAAYSSATIVGDTYKVRLTLNNDGNTGTPPVANTRAYTFSVCVKTPTDPCSLGIANGSFEDPESVFGGLNNMFAKQLIPGWRYNIPGNEYFFFMDFSGTSPNTPTPYEGTQFAQLLTNQTTPNYDPADMVNIEGLYQDFDTSEMTQLTYSYAQAIRGSSPTAVQMFMGPPAGPFVLIEDNISTSIQWTVQSGTYDVPTGQSKTRIMFRTKNPIGGWIVLDDISITANNEILTQPHSLACGVDGTSVSARGVGQWIADENNPSDVVIATPNSGTSAITGFVLSGDYTFTWKTRYCEETIVVNKIANDEIPAVTTPVEYCIDTVSTPLTAPELAGYTLAWYDVETGGTALTAAPTPVTTAAGTTPYYVAYVDAVGCEGVRAQIDVVVNDKTNPVVGFSYDAAAYCAIATDPVITLDADFAPNGTFTATPSGLAIDAATGAIDLSASTAGTYDVTYDVAAVDCINPGTNTVTVTVNAAVIPVVGFTYTDHVCLNSTTALLPAEAAGFAAGGTYASATVTVDAVTGEIDLATATAGIHDITYSIAADTSLAGCVEAGTSTFQITLVQPTVPVTGFSYAAAYCIAEANPTPSTDANFYVGGTFTAAPAGLAIDAATGAIDLAASAAGTYDITYAVTEADCLEAGSTTVTVTVNPLTAPVGIFSYESPACINSGTELVPILDELFTLGGEFSSATVTVDAATGIIDLTTATPGEHDIVYTLAVDPLLCIDGGTFTTKVELKAGVNPVTDFSYEDAYCYESTNTLPQTAAGFTAGGKFSSTDGLVIDPSTGAINVAGSTPGTYSVTYTIAADADSCNVGGSYTDMVSVSGSLDAAVSQECRSNNAWLFATPVNGLFDAEAVSYVWKNEAGAVVGTEAAFNVTAYAQANSLTELPMDFTVTVTSGSCSNEVGYSMITLMCEVPKGISPNGDGLNDSLNLTGMGVKTIEIFNRYGKKVYSHGSGYTNQWHGQDNNNNELPDGTYYYSIQNADGGSKTGWVYINRPS